MIDLISSQFRILIFMIAAGNRFCVCACVYKCVRVNTFLGVARILSHEGGVMDMEVLQVCQ